MAYVDPVKDSTQVVSLNSTEQIKDKILQLQESLQKQLPNYEGLLHTIHQALAKDPDTVHFLSDQEIGVIVSGLSKKTGVVVAEKEAKKKIDKSLKGITLADL